MNHKAIVIKQLHEQRTKLQFELDGIVAAISALGGTVGNSTGKAGAARTGAKKGGWPAGKKRGPRKAPVADPVTGLTPIQKAQAARRAKLEAKKAATATVPAAGADLGAAAAT